MYTDLAPCAAMICSEARPLGGLRTDFAPPLEQPSCSSAGTRRSGPSCEGQVAGCSELHFQLQELYAEFEAALKKHPKNIHSLRFNTRLHNSKNKVRASSKFLNRPTKFSRTLVHHPLAKLKKRKLAIELAKKFGTLTSKNCMLYLELLYSNRKPKALTGPGSL